MWHIEITRQASPASSSRTTFKNINNVGLNHFTAGQVLPGSGQTRVAQQGELSGPTWAQNGISNMSMLVGGSNTRLEAFFRKSRRA